jgi:ABC-2 type transport system ATP-binding protein
MEIVSVQNLSKIYKNGFLRRTSLKVLKNVSLSVQKGEIYGLLGPNGAGKTTLVKILLGIVNATEGNAYIYDKTVRKPSSREKIGFLPENHRYPLFLTANDILLLSGRMKEYPERAAQEKAKHLLNMVGLNNWGKTKLKKFSKGMAQRLGLAEALMGDPELLFLDEPTDGVDPIGRKEIRDILKILKQEGKTIFINSHILAEVELICDRVGILHKGELIKTGRLEDITSRGSEYEIKTIEPISASILNEIAKLTINLSRDGNLLIVTLASRDSVNSIVQLITNSGCSLESIHPRKMTLEESFISLIQSENSL